MVCIDFKTSYEPCLTEGIAGTSKEEACWEMQEVCEAEETGKYLFVTDAGEFSADDKGECYRMVQDLNLANYELAENYDPHSIDIYGAYKPSYFCVANYSWPGTIYFTDGTSLQIGDRSTCFYEAPALAAMGLKIDHGLTDRHNPDYRCLRVTYPRDFKFPADCTPLAEYLLFQPSEGIRRLLSRIDVQYMAMAVKRVTESPSFLHWHTSRLLNLLGMFSDAIKNGDDLLYFAERLRPFYRSYVINYELILRPLARLVHDRADLDTMLTALERMFSEITHDNARLLAKALQTVEIDSLDDLKNNGSVIAGWLLAAPGNEELCPKIVYELTRNEYYGEALDALIPMSDQAATGAGLKEGRHWPWIYAIFAELLESASSMPQGDNVKWGNSVVESREDVRKKLIVRMDDFLASRSPVEFRLSLLRDALEEEKFSFKLVTTDRAHGATVKRFAGIKGLSLVYLEGADAPEAVPGEASLSNGNLIVRGYNGWPGLTVVFKNPEKILADSNEAMMSVQQAMPGGFFYRVYRTTFFHIPDSYKADGIYLGNEVWINVSEKKPRKDTIVHEFAHHWDLANTQDYNQGEGGFGDLSALFKKISWEGVDEKRYIHDYVPNKLKDRDDFDRLDFVWEYGMTNPTEDIATTVEMYVMNGDNFRRRAREQMDKGNFEFAIKYMYVKYVIPFEGKEYGAEGGDGDSPLDFEEIRSKIAEKRKPTGNIHIFKRHEAEAARCGKLLDRIEEIQQKKKQIFVW